ncbi:MAG: efflux RND transporter periplasmic adaptor subunit [Cocleimonas sp.]
MKFILKTFSFLLIIVVILAALWLVTDDAEHQSIYDNTVTKFTSKTYEETFGKNGASPNIDDVKDDTVVEHSKRHSDPNYVCPMHPQIVKGEEGSCPICGMDLVLNEDESEEEQEQPEKSATIDDVKDDTVVEHSKRHSDPNYVCPMHPQIVKGEEGSCPICGMDLVLNEAEPEEEPKKKKQSKEKKIAYWVAPMDANFRRDKPGKSLMGMDLVPVYEEGDDGENDKGGLPKITIDATTAQNMGVRSITASKQELSRTIKTIGSVTYNEDSLHHVHVRAKGWVEKVYTKSLGDPVSKGRALLDFYSPEIVAAQKDLILASKRSSQISGGRGTSLSASSKIRLRDLNVPANVITNIARKGKSQNNIPIIAKHDGVVVKVGIRDGMYITPQTELYTIANLSSVWVIVDVFEHQLTWVNVGDKAEIQVQGVPGKTWQGEVDYIYPELNPKTRTLKVRLTIATPKQLLKPNMFADVSILSSSKQAISVPVEAIIYYENSPRVVKVVSDEGAKKLKYQPVEVKIGMKSNGMVEIVKGIVEGDRIVASGQFMIDSESNLKASFRRLRGE